MHIKQRVPPEQPAGLLQFTREEERDGEALNLVVMGSEEERGRRWGNSHKGKGREGNWKKRAEERWAGSWVADASLQECPSHAWLSLLFLCLLFVCLFDLVPNN